MLVKKELVAKIKDQFDLNIYETKVWLALLSKGVASAGEVAELSGVPRSRTYDVLESLEKKGFAIIKLGKPVKYLGVKPNLIIEKLKNNVKKDATDRIASLGKIKETDEFEQLEELYREGIDPVKREEMSVALRGKSNITNYLRDILSNAEKEVIVCTNASDFMPKLSLFMQTFNLLEKNGVKVNFALSGDKELINKISDKLGKKVKHVNVDAKFFIVDRKEILFYLSKESLNDNSAIWLNSPFFSDAFASLFENALK